MTNKVYLEWENVNFTWDNLDMLWEEVAIIQEVGEVIRRSGGSTAYVKGNPWEKTREQLGEEKTKKFIRVVCKVNGLEYDDVIDPNPKIKVTADHIDRVFTEAIKVGVKIDFKK
jgi:hypothetical protein